METSHHRPQWNVRMWSLSQAEIYVWLRVSDAKRFSRTLNWNYKISGKEIHCVWGRKCVPVLWYLWYNGSLLSQPLSSNRKCGMGTAMLFSTSHRNSPNKNTLTFRYIYHLIKFLNIISILQSLKLIRLPHLNICNVCEKFWAIICYSL